MTRNQIVNKPVVIKLHGYDPRPGTVVGVENDGFWIKSPELVAELHKLDQPPKPKDAVVFVPTDQLDWLMAAYESGEVKVSSLST